MGEEHVSLCKSSCAYRLGVGWSHSQLTNLSQPQPQLRGGSCLCLQLVEQFESLGSPVREMGVFNAPWGCGRCHGAMRGRGVGEQGGGVGGWEAGSPP